MVDLYLNVFCQIPRKTQSQYNNVYSCYRSKTIMEYKRKWYIWKTRQLSNQNCRYCAVFLTKCFSQTLDKSETSPLNSVWLSCKTAVPISFKREHRFQSGLVFLKDRNRRVSTANRHRTTSCRDSTGNVVEQQKYVIFHRSYDGRVSRRRPSPISPRKTP